MSWYRANFSDRGAGMTGQTFYIEATSEYSARENARKHAKNDMDPDSVEVKPVDKTEDEIKYSVFMASGPNRAYKSDGTPIRRDEIDVNSLDVDRPSF